MRVTLLRLIMAMALSGFSLNTPNAYANETAAMKQQIGQLNDRIAQLEKQLAAQETPQQRRHYDPAWQAGYMSQWDPFLEMEMMRQNLHGMLGSLPMDTFVSPTVDIKETPKEYTITMDIPGMNKDSIDINIEGRSLVVSGERTSDQTEEDKGKMVHRERSYSRFMRAVPLPADAKADAVDAEYKNGVLNIRVGRNPGSAKPAAQKITIK